MYNVLIVDEEEHLLSALEQNLFPDRDDIAITVATDGETGLEKLREGPFDLLISDIKMPGRIDGFQLILRAKEVAPDARVIIMTAFGSNRVQNFAERIGITHYIEKPFNTSELRDAVLEILDEKEGFQGVLSDLELTDIIQMLCLARRTALLHLKHRDRRGRIIFDNGEITHAEFDDLVGEKAVYRMLALRQGDIFMQSDFKPHERTIEVGWQDVLFEGVKRADEERLEIEAQEDDEVADAFGTREKTVHGVPAAGPEPPAAEADALESFFSEDELAEIEQATVDAALDDRKLPFATLDEHSDDVLVPDSRDETDDFRTPFQREASAIIKRTGDHDATPRKRQRTEEHTVAKARPAASSQPAPAADPKDIEELLAEFARDCPGLRQTGVLSVDDGLPIAFVNSEVDGYDPESMAALFGKIVHSARSTVDSFRDDEFVELQLAVGTSYILVRVVPGSSHLHVAVIDRTVSLGVAIVLMRRFQNQLLDSELTS